MHLLLIGCEVILRELCEAVARSPHVVDVRFLTKGLHDLGAKAMRAALQEAIDAVELAPESRDAIVLGYGLCGNGLLDLEARSIPLVIPRAHDCLTLLMGSRTVFEHYFQDHPGTCFRSAGWLERGKEIEPLAQARTGTGFTLDALIERYGEDEGRYLYEELTRYRQVYQQLTYIETGLEPDRRFEDQARAEARQRGWRFEAVPGDLTLFRRLLAGDWDDRDFLVVPPRHRVVPTYDERVIAAEAITP
jgi:hypothetical protein